MNRADALKRLRKILGKDLAYREDQSALTGEAREEASLVARAAHAAYREMKDALESRRAELLAGDAEYQRLKTSATQAYAAANQASATATAYRITVGTTNSLFFHVKAQGDNWQEVVDKLSEVRS